MCGRYSNTRTDDELRRAFGVQSIAGPELEPSWNVAPTNDVRIVLDRAEQESGTTTLREMRTAHWGLVPSWAKDTQLGTKMINARIETVLDKPAYKAAARKRRCILPADGYFEWQHVPEQKRRKQPYFLHAEQEEPLAFAGLYEIWKNPNVDEGDPHRWLVSTTVITHRAADTLNHVHDRMPLIVPPDLLGDWLDPATQNDTDVRRLLAAIPDPTLVPRKVSTLVNNVRNNQPEVVDTID